MPTLSNTEKKIHKASENGDLKKLKKVLKSPKLWFSNKKRLINSMDQDEYQSTPLHKATEHLDIVEFLIQKGADVNAKDENGSTPLIYAAGDGQIKVVKYLIEHGAQMKYTDQHGNTPLHSAAEMNENLVLEYLIEKHGAQVNMKNEFGETPLHLAAEHGEIEAIKCLIEHGAKLESRDRNGKTPLAAYTKHKHKNIVRMLNPDHPF